MITIDSSKVRIYKERTNAFLSAVISLLIHAIAIVYWLNYRDVPETLVTIAVNIVPEEPPAVLDEEDPDKEVEEKTADDTSTLMHDALSESQSPVNKETDMLIDQEHILTIDALPNKPPGVGILGNNGLGLGDGVKLTFIGGNFIRAKKLGVIIDTSGSMIDLRRTVKHQVEGEFPNAPTLLIDGCFLIPETVQQIIRFVDDHHTDSLFWFCDLQDSHDTKAVEKLQNHLTQNNVRLYIRTYDRPGCETIRMLVEKTKGSIFLEERSLEWLEDDSDSLFLPPLNEAD